MLYSAELRRHFRDKPLFFFFHNEFLLLNPGLFTGEIAEVEDSCPADFTDLVDLDAFDSRGLVGEDSFYADTVGNLADREGLGEGRTTGDLDNYTSEFLESLFVSFLDFKGDGDGITGLELGVFGYFLVLERLLY